ncbi:MAG TPA: aminoglycoside phosphotransferase family protein [Ktedonobacterales bacterium]|nr:aminoglycoside phosphotransferase family protein [Ktedonobacterales bacterium]
MQPASPIAEGRTAEIFAWSEGQVLKLFRPGWEPEVAAHEAAIARTLDATGVPVPRVGDLTEVDGRPGIVYERVTGPSLLTILSSQPLRLPAVARTLGEVHASVHQHTVPMLPNLREVLARRIQAVTLLPPAQQRAALDSLEALPDGEALCHGDYHPDNVLLSPRGPLVIDWGNAALGDPLADVARTLLLMRASFVYPKSRAERIARRALTATLNRLYLRRYRQLRPIDRARLTAWELPITAARLIEDIAEEESYLRARVWQLTATSRA